MIIDFYNYKYLFIIIIGDLKLVPVMNYDNKYNFNLILCESNVVK